MRTRPKPKSFLFNLTTLPMEACHLREDFRPLAKKTWLCPGGFGYHPVPQCTSVDVVIQNIQPKYRPLNFVWDAGIGLIHRELLDAIGPSIVERDLYLGKVVNDHDELLKDWFTFRGRRGVFIRGTKYVELRCCTACGQTDYFAQGTRHLAPHFPTDASIFECQNWTLLVPQEVRDQVMSRHWSRLRALTLPVYDPPLDGNGELPFK